MHLLEDEILQSVAWPVIIAVCIFSSCWGKRAALTRLRRLLGAAADCFFEELKHRFPYYVIFFVLIVIPGVAMEINRTPFRPSRENLIEGIIRVAALGIVAEIVVAAIIAFLEAKKVNMTYIKWIATVLMICVFRLFVPFNISPETGVLKIAWRIANVAAMVFINAMMVYCVVRVSTDFNYRRDAKGAKLPERFLVLTVAFALCVAVVGTTLVIAYPFSGASPAFFAEIKIPEGVDAPVWEILKHAYYFLIPFNSMPLSLAGFEEVFITTLLFLYRFVFSTIFLQALFDGPSLGGDENAERRDDSI